MTKEAVAQDSLFFFKHKKGGCPPVCKNQDFSALILWAVFIRGLRLTFNMPHCFNQELFDLRMKEIPEHQADDNAE
jgi:hypothetical protein